MYAWNLFITFLKNGTNSWHLDENLSRKHILIDCANSCIWPTPEMYIFQPKPPSSCSTTLSVLDILSNSKCTVTKTFGHLTCTFQFRGEQICQTNAKHKTWKSFFACCDVSLLLLSFRGSLSSFHWKRFIVVCGSIVMSNVKYLIDNNMIFFGNDSTQISSKKKTIYLCLF